MDQYLIKQQQLKLYKNLFPNLKWITKIIKVF
jgi:hypothetical protein